MCGDLDAADDHLNHAEACLEKLGTPYNIANLHWRRARLALMRDAPHDALAHLSQLAPAPQSGIEWATRCLQIDAWASLGDRDALESAIHVFENTSATPRRQLDQALGVIAHAQARHALDELTQEDVIWPDVVALMRPQSQGRRAVAECSVDIQWALRRLLARLTPTTRASFWADAIDPHNHAFCVSAAADRCRLPKAQGWISLGRRRILHRLLLALIQSHFADPDATLDNDDLLEAGWPDEQIMHDAAINRLHRALADLRKKGFAGLIQHTSTGYRLDPESTWRHLPDLWWPRTHTDSS